MVYAENRLDREAWDARTMLTEDLASEYEIYLRIVLETAIRL